jgi:predicted helicase
VSGVQTKNDAVFVGFTPAEVARQVRQWLAGQGEKAELDERLIRPYLVAPFDRRWIYYDPRLIGRARYGVMQHLLRPNLALVFMRQSTVPGEYDHFLAVDCPVSDRAFYSRRGAPFLAPLWTEPDAIGQSNLAPSFVAECQAATGSRWEPITLFHYLYAVCHAPTYRRRYDALLRRDFPRWPLPPDREALERLAAAGRQLGTLHLLQPGIREPGPVLAPAANGKIETGDFRIGGYDVIRRWHAQRRRRALTQAEEEHAARLAAIGAETARLRREIDALWAAAFPDLR